MKRLVDYERMVLEVECDLCDSMERMRVGGCQVHRLQARGGARVAEHCGGGSRLAVASQ